MIIDIDHTVSGIASEISSLIYENFENKKIKKIGNVFSPSPVSEELEKIFYPSEKEILNTCCELLKLKKIDTFNEDYNYKANYKISGPY